MNWRIQMLAMGEFRLDGGAMFGIVPKPLWAKAQVPDDRNRIRMRTNCMLLSQAKHHVLVEAGCGAWNFETKEREFYAMEQHPHWREALKPCGIEPEQVTDVILSHLHFDHAGGLVDKLADGKYHLNFPNAVHWLQKRHFEWAQQPTERDRGSFRPEGLYPFTCGKVPTELIDGDAEILPGIRVATVDGHTPAQQLIHIDAGKEHWVFVSDLFATASHLHLPWIMAYDLTPLNSLQEKKTFLAEAVAKKWALWFYHDPHTTGARVIFDGKRYMKGDDVCL